MQELTEHLRGTRHELVEAVAAVPTDRHARAPAPGRWSVAEVLEHLGRVERQVAALLGRALEAAKAKGLPPETASTSILAAMDGARLLDRQQRFVAPPVAEPAVGADPAAAWPALAQSRVRLLTVVHAADGLAVGGIVAPHPFLGELDFYQWIAFVGFHERRHAEQIREIGRALAS